MFPFLPGPLRNAAVATALAATLCAAAAAEPAPMPGVSMPGASAPSPQDPSHAGAPVPALTHRSSLASRPPPGEPDVGDWRAANERVRAAGGWRAYLREAQR